MDKNTWNLTPLFSGDEDKLIEKEIKVIEEMTDSFVAKWRNNEKYLTNESILLESLNDYEEWETRCSGGGAVGYYFWLRTQQDQNDPKIQAKYNKITSKAIELGNKVTFFILNIANIDLSLQKQFLKSPLLKDYRHFLERVFIEKKHLLSEKEEAIMSLKSPFASEQWESMTSKFIHKEERVILNKEKRKEKKSFEEIISLTANEDKSVRDMAAKAFNDVLDKYKEVAECEINAILGNKKVDDELRHFSLPESNRLLSDDMEQEVVNTLIDVVSSNNNIACEYYNLKARLFGVTKLSYHERNMEYGNVSSSFGFKEGVSIVEKVFSDLDTEFKDIFNRMLKNGQVDVFPKKGKCGGAFCIGFTKMFPTYVLLNYTDDLKSVTTLAHEFGHAINDELIKKSQNSLNGGTTLATAEVASTFMEDFVLQELLLKATDEEKLSIYMNKLNEEISTIFRQVACYKFERELHDEFRKKGYLSYKDIGKIFQKHMGAYMGDSVELSKGSENWWIYWSHIRTFFYVYSYANGLLISKAMQFKVKENKEFVQKVKEFLSAGTSLSPKKIFSNMGIDITDRNFWLEGIKEIKTLLTETEKLAKKLKKI